MVFKQLPFRLSDAAQKEALQGIEQSMGLEEVVYDYYSQNYKSQDGKMSWNTYDKSGLSILANSVSLFPRCRQEIADYLSSKGLSLQDRQINLWRTQGPVPKHIDLRRSSTMNYYLKNSSAFLHVASEKIQIQDQACYLIDVKQEHFVEVPHSLQRYFFSISFDLPFHQLVSIL